MGGVTDAWARPAIDVAADLGVDPSVGLISAEAAARLERHGRNALDPAAEVPTWRKLLAQLQDPLVYLLIGAVIVSFVAWLLEGAEGVPFEVIVIAVIIVANAILGYVQEAKAEEAVAALQRMAATTTAVRRDGRQVRVTAEELVPGDVMLLAEGDAVAADGRLLEAATLMVAEASLTGESEAVLKDVDPVGADGASVIASTWCSAAPPSPVAAASPWSPPRAWRPRSATSPACSARPKPSRRRCSVKSTGSGGCSASR